MSTEYEKGNKMEYLDKKLKEYAATEMYPFHMPGHKRRQMSVLVEDQSTYTREFDIDITEIEGFDNLHHAEGILKEAQERAAALYGARRSWYLVNGSTCGILAAVFATVSDGGHLLMARNSHKAAYHAAQLRHAKVHYLYPEIIDDGLQGIIEPEKVEQMLMEHPQIEAVFLTSPTYDGIVSDISRIAEIVHSYGKSLIVDEAHGAHFGMHPYFPETAVNKGADLVIMSMHKTLPSYTQTALLHSNSKSIEDGKVEQFLDIFETSSPSYVFMAGMDRCIREIGRHKQSWFEAYAHRLQEFYKQTEQLKHIYIWKRSNQQPDAVYDHDPSKLLIFSKDHTVTGKDIYDMLRTDYQLQLEMYAGNYCTALTAFMDTQEGFDRLRDALFDIDRRWDELFCVCQEVDVTLESQKKIPVQNQGWMNDRYQNEISSGNQKQVSTVYSHRVDTLYIERTRFYELYELEEKARKTVSLEAAIGEISAEYVYLYPPGIPVLVPGEQIEPDLIAQMQRYIQAGYLFQGLKDESNQSIEVVKKES